MIVLRIGRLLSTFHREFFKDCQTLCFTDAKRIRSEASKVENATVEMLRDLDQQMERKEDGESMLIRPKLVQETTDKVVLIKEKLKAVRDRQKSYADNKRKPLEFEIRDQVLLKALPWKGVICFRKKGKLAPRIMDREVKKLKHSRISIVKVRWNSKRRPEFT
nr:reverse transcriptase domain-containing protein [Tanacetum cinerariifolium]